MNTTSEADPILAREMRIIEYYITRGGGNQHMLVMGPGALLWWHQARELYNELIVKLNELDEKETLKDSGLLFPHNFLGYPFPDHPYYPAETIVYDLDYLATGIDDLLERYPAAQIDFLCHSFSGTVALYWAIQREAEGEIEMLQRVRSLTTVNSPLKGSDRFLDTVRAEFYDEGDTFLNQEGIPPIFEELSKASARMHAIEGAKRIASPLRYLFTVGTRGDTTVAPDFATVKYATHRYIISGSDLGKKGRHNDALKSNEFIRKYADFLRSLPT